VGVFTSVLAVQNLGALRPGSPGAVYLLFGVIWVALRLREWRQASVMTPQGFRDMMREAERTAAMRRVPGRVPAPAGGDDRGGGRGAAPGERLRCTPTSASPRPPWCPEYIRGGEAWRLLTAGYLHVGIIHFAVNFMALLSLGRETEVLAHRAHLALVFLAAVLGGSLASFAVPPDNPSVGSSGGLMGLIGFLGVLAYRRARRCPRASSRWCC
jgi:hypothetical protein